MLELMLQGPYPQLRRRAGASSSGLCIHVLYLSHQRSHVVVAPSIQQNPTMHAYLQACLSLIVVMFGVAAQHAMQQTEATEMSCLLPGPHGHSSEPGNVSEKLSSTKQATKSRLEHTHTHARTHAHARTCKDKRATNEPNTNKRTQTQRTSCATTVSSGTIAK